MRKTLLFAAVLLVGCGDAFEADVFGDIDIEQPDAGAATSSTGAGGGGGEGGAAPAACTTAKDCGAPPTAECGSWACAEHVCVLAPVDAGKLMEGNVPGDCKILVCDGNGGAEYLPAADPKDDGKPCTIDACDGFTQPPSANAAPDEPCPTGVCNGNGACVECLHGYQCGSGVCADMACQ